MTGPRPGAGPAPGSGPAAGSNPGSGAGPADRERGSPPGPASGPGLDEVLREHWWAAVAAVARRCGDLEIAEDAVQEACAAAVTQWPAAGLPPSPRGWLITTAWHKAADLMRRDSVRASREAAAARDWPGRPTASRRARRPVARAELLRRLGRASAAEVSYRRALDGDMSLAERYHLQSRLAEVTRR